MASEGKDIQSSNVSMKGTHRPTFEKLSPEEIDKIRQDLLADAHSSETPSAQRFPWRGFATFLCAGSLIALVVFYDKVPWPAPIAKALGVSALDGDDVREENARRYDGRWPAFAFPAPGVAAPAQASETLAPDAAYACLVGAEPNPCKAAAWKLPPAQFAKIRASAIAKFTLAAASDPAACAVVGALWFQDKAPGRSVIKSQGQWKKCSELFPADSALRALVGQARAVQAELEAAVHEEQSVRR